MALCSEVAMTDAEKENEARCKAMLNEFISVVKKQTMQMEDLVVRMNELAVGLKDVVQPRRVPDHTLPPSVSAPTPTLVVAVDHAVAAAAPVSDTALAPESPSRCTTSGLDPNAGCAKVTVVSLLSRGVTTAIRAQSEPAYVASSKSFATGELDNRMPAGCSMIGSGDDTASQTSAFMSDAAPGSPSTIALRDVANTSPELTVATIRVRDDTSDLTAHRLLDEMPQLAKVDSTAWLRPSARPTFIFASTGVYLARVAPPYIGVRDMCYLVTDIGHGVMVGVGPGDAVAGSGHVSLISIDQGDTLACTHVLCPPDDHKVLWPAPMKWVERRSWLPPAHTEIMGDSVEPHPQSWRSFNCYQGEVQPVPPWPPPQGPETVLKLFHKQARVQSWVAMFTNAEMGGLNSLVHGVILVEQLLLLYWDYGKIQSLFWVMVGLVWAWQGVEAMDLFQLVISSGIGFDVVRLSEFFIACAGVKGYLQGLQVHSSYPNYEMESKEQKPTHQRNESVDLTSSKVSAENIEAKIVSERPVDDENEVVENGIVNGIADAKKPGSPNTVRLYSIASTRYGDSFDGRTASLCVRRAVYYDPETGKEDPSKKGICSNFLCDSKPGDKIQITGPSGKIMLLPEDDPNATHIMIATGTGIAPFRGYLRRMFMEDVPTFNFGGLAWLFLGVANTDSLLYDEEFTNYLQQYPDNFWYDKALSREQKNRSGGKMYVQDKIEEYSDKILACPRCNSMDTKFCYYNNYNINQPRHFCKSCQRYWTAGGIMRNVPVGAGRRKSKSSSANCRSILIPGSSLAAHGGDSSLFPLSRKGNQAAVKFGPDSPFRTSVLKIVEQSKNANPASTAQPRNGENQTCPPSATASDSLRKDSVKGTISGHQNGITGHCNGVTPMHPIPCFPGPPFVYPWSPAWNGIPAMAAPVCPVPAEAANSSENGNGDDSFVSAWGQAAFQEGRNVTYRLDLEWASVVGPWPGP